MEDLYLRGWCLRDDGSSPQTAVGDPPVGDELPEIRVMERPKYEWGLLRTNYLGRFASFLTTWKSL